MRQSRFPSNVLPLLAAFLLSAATAPAQSILNGSFESPTVATNTFQNVTPTSWSWEGVAGVVFNGTVGAPWPSASAGKKFVDIGNHSLYALSQAFTVTARGDFELSWLDATPASVQLKTSPYSATVLNGAFQSIAAGNFDAYHAQGNWQPHSLVLSLTNGTYLVRFQAQGTTDGLDTLLDSVTLMPLANDLQPTITVASVDVCWLGRTNEIYQLQYRTNLASTTWFNLGSPLSGSGTNCVTDVVTGTEKRFYRVVRSP